MNVINSDPELLGGIPVFNGTRVPIKNLFDYLETGETIAEFLDDFPSVAREQVLSVLSFSQQILKELYLDKHIFAGLTNLNNGFDAPSIKYFSASDFELVLKRVQQHGLGICGIEPWHNGEFYGVVAYEEVTDDPKDASWYFDAFESFKESGVELQYSASYSVPEVLLAKE